MTTFKVSLLQVIQIKSNIAFDTFKTYAILPYSLIYHSFIHTLTHILQQLLNSYILQHNCVVVVAMSMQRFFGSLCDKRDSHVCRHFCCSVGTYCLVLGCLCIIYKDSAIVCVCVCNICPFVPFCPFCHCPSQFQQGFTIFHTNVVVVFHFHFIFL